jgi:hypothetical protein
MDVIELIDKQRDLNIQELKEYSDNMEVTEKLERYLIRNKKSLPKETTIESLRRELQTNIHLAVAIAVNPSRQKPHEKKAEEWLQKYAKKYFFTPLYGTTIKLHDVGMDALFLQDGKIIKREEKNTNNTNKALDFGIKMGKYNILISQRFTSDKGGEQSTSEKEIISFMKEAKLNTVSTTYFLAIVDGDYYTVDKIDYLNENFGSRRVIALSMDNVPSFLQSLI